jgi:DNA polymerase-3 subunit gamma/tau
MMDAFAAGNGAAVFGTVDRVVEGGHDPRRFAADLLDRLRDLIILAAVPGAGQSGLLDAPADRLERMAEQAGRFGQAELTRAAEIISDGLIQMRGTTSPRLLLELMCAQVLLPAASTGEKALLARLERLEHQLAGVESGPGETVDPPRGRRSGPAVDRGGPTVDQDEPAGQGGSPAGRNGPAAGRGGPGAGRSGPGRDRGESQDGPGPDPDGSDLRGDTGPGGDAGSREDAGSDASTGSDASSRHDVPGPRGGTGPVDAEALRQRWPEILDAVRSEKKVAWMLLNTASVQELESGVLTIAFPSEGNARGFASSGHDQVLTGALTALLGLNVRVRAVAGAPQAASTPAGGRAAPGQAPRSRPAPGRTQEAPGPSGSRAAGPAASGPPSSDPPAGPQPGSRTRGPAAAPDDGGPARAVKDPGGPSAAAGQQASPARSRPVPPGPQPAALADEEWPDDAGPAAAGREDLTGMELIRRQLGGQVIQEIEDS